MDAAMKAGLSTDSIHVFWAVEIALSGSTIRLTDSIDVTWSRGTFSGFDPVYGSLSKVSGLEDGIETALPSPSFELSSIAKAGIVALSNPTEQGARVRIFFGSWNKAAGQPHGEPEQVFVGRLDEAENAIAPGAGAFKISCITGEASQLEPSAQRRASAAFHQAAWPGELGMSNIPFLSRKYYWRADEPRGGAAATSTGGNPAIDVIDGVLNQIV